MSQLSLHHRLLTDLEEMAIPKKGLLGEANLSALAQALEPVIELYVAKKGAFPDAKTLHTMAINVNQDGARVFALLKTRHTDDSRLWERLRKELEQQARRRWPTLCTADQKEIAHRTWLRIHRYLPNFRFMARFSTWAAKILLNEYLRVEPKLSRYRQALSLDQVNQKGQSLADILPSKTEPLPESLAHSQTIQHFWQRMEQLEQSLNLNILRLHLAGYTLEEIKQKLEVRRSVSTIWKRREQVFARIEQDSIMQEIAQQLGILPLRSSSEL